MRVRPPIAALVAMIAGVTTRGRDANLYTTETVAAVDAFRASERLGKPQMGGSPVGLMEAESVERL
jgi:hypothetical protein